MQIQKYLSQRPFHSKNNPKIQRIRSTVRVSSRKKSAHKKGAQKFGIATGQPFESFDKDQQGLFGWGSRGVVVGGGGWCGVALSFPIPTNY